MRPAGRTRTASAKPASQIFHALAQLGDEVFAHADQRFASLLRSHMQDRQRRRAGVASDELSVEGVRRGFRGVVRERRGGLEGCEEHSEEQALWGHGVPPVWDWR